MDKFNFYKEAYYKELELKNDLNNSISFPVAIITIFIGAFFYLLLNFNYSCQIWFLIIFILFSIHFCLTLLLSIYNIIRSYSNSLSKGYDYGYLPRLDQIYYYYNKLNKYYMEKEEEGVDLDFEKWLISIFSEYTSISQNSNRLRITYLYRAKKFLIYSFIFLVFVTILFIINYFMT